MDIKQRSSMFFSTLIVAVLFFGVALPQLLMGFESYEQMRSSWRPYDIQFLAHEVFRMTLVLVAWIVLRKLAASQQATLGLRTGFKRAMTGFALGLACSVPMLALGLIAGDQSDSYRFLAYKTLLPGIAEEIFYRAFAFGLLVQLARWRLWNAAIFTGIVFGLAHIDFSPDPEQTILGQLNFGIALIALGGVLYAWLYARADWNLWIVIALHFAMNLWWHLFSLAELEIPNPGLWLTLSRVLSVSLAIYFVVFARLLRTHAALRSADAEHTEGKRAPEHD